MRWSRLKQILHTHWTTAHVYHQQRRALFIHLKLISMLCRVPFPFYFVSTVCIIFFTCVDVIAIHVFTSVFLSSVQNNILCKDFGDLEKMWMWYVNPAEEVAEFCFSLSIFIFFLFGMHKISNAAKKHQSHNHTLLMQSVERKWIHGPTSNLNRENRKYICSFDT